MSEDDVPTFDAAGAGASLTYPMQAGALRKGGHVILKEKPCKIIEISVSKTGKHGHAKAAITGIDIFTGKKLEDATPCSHNMSVPNVDRVEYPLLMVDGEEGAVSALDGGDTKDDLNLPTDASGAREQPICDDLIKAFDDGKEIVITVMKAMGMEKVIAFREQAAK